MKALINNKSKHGLSLGILFIGIGLIFIMRNAGVLVPQWILSWPAFMLTIGLWIGYRRNFKPAGWVALVIIGGIFTLKNIMLLTLDLSAYTGALIFIGLGLFLILKPKKEHQFCDFRRKKSVDSDPAGDENE